MINSYQKARLESMLRDGEMIDWSMYPWPKPRKGDAIRAEVLFDRDPGGTVDESMMERQVSNCEVWTVIASDSEQGVAFIHFHDADGLPLPTEISKGEYEARQTWGSVEVWNDKYPPTDHIPLTAIKQSLLHGYAKTLARRSENLERGLYS